MQQGKSKRVSHGQEKTANIRHRGSLYSVIRLYNFIYETARKADFLYSFQRVRDKGQGPVQARVRLCFFYEFRVKWKEPRFGDSFIIKEVMRKSMREPHSKSLVKVYVIKSRPDERRSQNMFFLGLRSTQRIQSLEVLV